jgi:hypothetical protein
VCSETVVTVHDGNVVIRSHAKGLKRKFVALRTADGVVGVDAFDARSLTWAPDSATLAVIKVCSTRNIF